MIAIGTIFIHHYFKKMAAISISNLYSYHVYIYYNTTTNNDNNNHDSNNNKNDYYHWCTTIFLGEITMPWKIIPCRFSSRPAPGALQA